MLANFLHSALQGQSLNETEAFLAMDFVTSNQNSLQSAALLGLLKGRGEAVNELIGATKFFREYCIPIQTPGHCMDIVGTGGDGSSSVNISTGSAILAAACGIPIAKHGNRAVSSRCGSADILEEFGVNIYLDADQITHCLQTIGIGFLFAQHFHPKLKAVSELRRTLGIPTLFNLLGPLIHPAKVPFALIGVGDRNHVRTLSECVARLGFKRALVFHGHGMDELTTIGPIHAVLFDQLKAEKFIPILLDPVQLGLSRCEKNALAGGSPQKNSELLMNALSGESGPLSDVLIMNAGIALWIYGKTSCPKEGIQFAREVHSKGLGQEKLKAWIKLSNDFSLKNGSH